MPPRHITAVALFGTKTGAFKGLLETVQAIIDERLRDRFHPYSLDQIHSTLVRLDGVLHAGSGLIVNQRYRELAGTSRSIDHARALEILVAYLTPPIYVEIGGHTPNGPMTFSSHGQHPYERMFSAQDGAFVLMGWPVSTIMSGLSRRPLDELRRKMNEANILHWYHESWIDIDNDFHLVVGHYSDVSQREALETVHAVLIYLSQHPIRVEVGLNQVAIVAANSPSLMPAQFIGQFPINPEEILYLYR